MPGAPLFPALSSCSPGTCPSTALSHDPPAPRPQQLSHSPSGQALWEALPPWPGLGGGNVLPGQPCSPPGPGPCCPSSRQLSPLTTGLWLQAPFPAFPFSPMPTSTGAAGQDTRAGKWCAGGSAEFLTSHFITVRAHHSGDKRVVRMASRNNCK